MITDIKPLGYARMFIIEGTYKVRDVIEKNRKRKLTKHKKLSNNTVIEIDNCSPQELLKLQMNPVKIAEGEEIPFVYEKRHTKTEIQQLYEELEECTKRLMKYKNYFIVHGYVSNDRTDYTTLVPELKKHFAAFGETLKEVTADSGIAAKKIFYS